MSKWVTFLLILICGFLIVGCGRLSSEKPLRLSSINQTVQVSLGGLTRTAIVHLPNEDSETPMPVVLVFHGGGGTAKGMQRISHFDGVADLGHFIAVYPEGYRRSWADGRGKTPADRAGVDDVGFINALLEQLEQQYRIDRRRIFATGLSNGAFFSQRLGCEL